MGFPQLRSAPPPTLPSPDVTVALIGVSATVAAGVLGVALALGLAGTAGTASAGTLAPQTTVALVGIAATGRPGVLAPSLTVGLLGSTGTGAIRALGAVVAAAEVRPFPLQRPHVFASGGGIQFQNRYSDVLVHSPP